MNDSHLDDPIDAKALLATWDDNAQAWTAAIRDQGIASRAYTNAALLACIGARRWQRLLDIGCGEGWLVRTLSDGAERMLIGVDGCQALVDAAIAADPQGHYVCAEYHALDTSDAVGATHFDWIVFNFALFGSAQDEAVLAYALTRLTARGRVLVQTLPAPAEGGEARRLERFEAMPGRWAPMPYRARDAAAWEQTVAAAGGQLLDRRPVHDQDGNTLSIIMEMGA